MEGLMMHCPLTIPMILDHGYRVHSKKEIISILPDKTRHQYTYSDLYKRSKKLMHALVNKLGVKKGDIIAAITHGIIISIWNYIMAYPAVALFAILSTSAFLLRKRNS